MAIKKLWVRSFTLDRLDLFWEVSAIYSSGDSVPHEIYNYQFIVFRSEAEYGPYQQISAPLRDQYTFRDTRVELLHNWRHYYYKVRVVNVTTSESQDYGPTSQLEPELDLIGNEIVRQEDLLFREYAGRKCWLFPARTFGPLCSCVDPIEKRKSRSAHLPCFGTGWLGGYMSPVEIFLQIDPYPKQVTQDPNGPRHINNTTARTIAYPPIAPRDILIESDNRRWRVETVTPTQRLRANVRQEMTIHELPKGDIEYSIPLNVDAKTVITASNRNFTNPHSIEEGSSYDDIIAVYGRPRGSVI